MPFEIVKPGTNVDFLGKWRICVTISAALILVGLAGIPLRGFRLGIDFAGGTEVQIRFHEAKGVDEGDIRDVVGGLGIANASVTRFGGRDAQEFLIKFSSRGEGEASAGGEGEASPGAESEASAGAESGAKPSPEAAVGEESQAAEEPAAEGPKAASNEEAQKGERGNQVDVLVNALEKAIGPLELERVDFVGPKVGAELREDGLKAITIACLLILVYIGFRFSVRFAPGAVVALIHDVLVTSSIWILCGLEFDLRVLAAILAIIGYSLNDTIIVYDRIRENMELRTKFDLKEVLNRSVNQTLSRTLLTSFTTLIAVLSLLLLGGEVIRPFALAMAIGIVVGTYSSIYIASPSLLWLEGRYGAGAGGQRAATAGREASRAPKPPKPSKPSKPPKRKSPKAASRRR